MKSIKEKAEELVENRVELSREESLAYFQGIEAGANYVLECIEKATSICFYEELRKVIEQLKKWAMKKIILLALTALIMVGCDYNSNQNIDTKTNGFVFGTIIIDSCEYISGTRKLAHKGNCRFCKERRQKELEELVINLKEK